MSTKMYFCLLLLNVLLSASYCKNAISGIDSTSYNLESTERLNPQQIKKSPIRHSVLSDEQMERIRNIHMTLTEVDASSFDDWVNDFKRDLHPEREIVIWETIAYAYSVFCGTRELDLLQKKEIFRVLLTRSSVPEEEVLNYVTLDSVSKDDAIEAMRLYNLRAKPITVIEK